MQQVATGTVKKKKAVKGQTIVAETIISTINAGGKRAHCWKLLDEIVARKGGGGSALAVVILTKDRRKFTPPISYIS